MHRSCWRYSTTAGATAAGATAAGVTAAGATAAGATVAGDAVAGATAAGVAAAGDTAVGAGATGAISVTERGATLHVGYHSREPYAVDESAESCVQNGGKFLTNSRSDGASVVIWRAFSLANTWVPPSPSTGI